MKPCRGALAPALQVADGVQVRILGKVIEDLGAETFLPELRARFLSGENGLGGVYKGLPKSLAFSEMREAFTALKEQRVSAGGNALSVMTQLKTAEAYTFLAERYSNFGRYEQYRVVSALSEEFKSDASLDQAQAAVVFLESLLPHAPKTKVRFEPSASDIKDLIAGLRTRYDLD